MALTITSVPVPLRIDADGVVRVGATRVTLDTVVYAFQTGATAEEIVQDYSTLDLADVYAVIAYYLCHRSEVEDYLREGQERAQVVRRQIEARFDPTGIRARLLARRKESPI